jgi:hypothetical protein
MPFGDVSPFMRVMVPTLLQSASHNAPRKVKLLPGSSKACTQ